MLETASFYITCQTLSIFKSVCLHWLQEKYTDWLKVRFFQMLTIHPLKWVEHTYFRKCYKFKQTLVEKTTTQNTIFTMDFCAEIQTRKSLYGKAWNKLLMAWPRQDFKAHGLMPYSAFFHVDNIVMYEGSEECLL